MDVRCFAIFIILQLFAQTAKYSSETRNNLVKDSWPGMKESSSSAIASPRSKATKINYTSSEYQIITHFVKTNLRLILRLVSSDIHNSEVSLSATEFNTLRVLFRVDQSSGIKTAMASQLSNLTPFF